MSASVGTDVSPQRRPNVVLTGFMATGKSTVGRMLAARLRYGFVDTDRIIEERHGSIPAIFSTGGEAGFRQIEREIAGELSGFSSLVISTGGGLMLDPQSASALEASGLVVCLTASPEVIFRRVGGARAGERRPLLAGDDPEIIIKRMLEERAPLYERFVQVSTDGRPPSEVAEQIALMVEGSA